jgi:hypothetical protein
VKPRRSGGWYLSGVATRELETEALMSLIFENTNSSGALFMIELFR